MSSDRADRAKRAAVALGVTAAVVLIVAGMAVGLVLVKYAATSQQRAKENQQRSMTLLGIVKNGTEQRQLILSCTTPGGACYERSVKQQASTVNSINQVTIAAVACARVLRIDKVAAEKTVPLMVACVKASLAKLPK